MINEHTLKSVISAKMKNIVHNYVRNLSVSARWPMLLEAFAAVHGLALCGLERDLTLLAAVRTDGLVHLVGAAVETSPSLTQLFHSF
jgi:hypothetical protein